MPMHFTDERLISTGEWMFRPKKVDETVDEYRKAFAEDQYPKDAVQAHEILTGRPWDEWTEQDYMSLVVKHPELLRTNPMMIAGAIKMLSSEQTPGERA